MITHTSKVTLDEMFPGMVIKYYDDKWQVNEVFKSDNTFTANFVNDDGVITSSVDEFGEEDLRNIKKFNEIDGKDIKPEDFKVGHRVNAEFGWCSFKGYIYSNVNFLHILLDEEYNLNGSGKVVNGRSCLTTSKASSSIRICTDTVEPKHLHPCVIVYDKDLGEGKVIRVNEEFVDVQFGAEMYSIEKCDVGYLLSWYPV